TPIQPETGTVIPVQNDSENRIDLNPRLIMFGSTPTAEATEILVVIGKNVGTEVAVTQSTALPKTGVADKWNIPMMILVVMVLLALILSVRLLRNKHSIK
ncbi:MAG TPA: LPXTG cell wall anchor domain-containing protein, partial [Flexilinea sp.]|nr:LPXTG cell wall anchor domain-containing protein [Flexilinea sp.]